jgi:hypothetical protein
MAATSRRRRISQGSPIFQIAVILFEIVAQSRQRPGPMLFYPAMKQLTLDLAAATA